MPRLERRRANPKDVAAVILGGGEGTKLFPLTSRTATPAVRDLSLLMNLHSFSQFFVLDA